MSAVVKKHFEGQKKLFRKKNEEAFYSYNKSHWTESREREKKIHKTKNGRLHNGFCWNFWLIIHVFTRSIVIVIWNRVRWNWQKKKYALISETRNWSSGRRFKLLCKHIFLTHSEFINTNKCEIYSNPQQHIFFFFINIELTPMAQWQWCTNRRKNSWYLNIKKRNYVSLSTVWCWM